MSAPDPVPAASPLSLFAGLGVELEYMIAHRDSLAILPVTDEVIRAASGEYVASFARGPMEWSNELALHVIELKTNGPAPALAGLSENFQREIRELNAILGSLNGRLLPTGMHPWMDPLRETRLWPHDYSPVYEAFNRIFGCQGHGWSNLQSLHLNLPFADDAEFARLHAAIRLLLPLLPALAASSPILDGAPGPCLDNRLEVYRTNCARIPSITGQVIPEPAWSRAEYEDRILQTIYRELASLDPEKTLQEEWVNARGAIARFDRQTIEIRVLDVQECPQADLAIAGVVISVLRALVDEKWSTLGSQQSFSTETLAALLQATIQQADQAVIANPDFLRVLGCRASSLTARELWRDLLDRLSPTDIPHPEALDIILRKGCLARRILQATGQHPDRSRLLDVYRALADCLENGALYTP